jgi:predicted MPP superfamily phosphohydrolase
MTIVLMSDLHTRPASVPEGDILILAGDIFCGDDVASLRGDLAWIKSLGFTRTLCVLGNHDLNLRHLLNTQPDTAHSLLGAAGITLLQDSDVVINGVRFYGLDWGSAAVLPRADVVISHCPAKGMLDQRQPPKSGHLGDAGLARQVALAAPRLVVSGHIHGGYGRAEHGGTTFVNCSLANENRRMVNPPVVIEV